MKPFKFKLHSLETLREKELEGSMRFHAERLAERSNAAAAVQQTERELDGNIVRWRQAMREGLSAHDFLQYEAAGTVLKAQLARRKRDFARAEADVEASLARLRLDQRELEALGKLKERHRKRHSFQEAAHEQRFLDDIAGRARPRETAQSLSHHV